jgi:hypothetical protein
MTPWSTGRSDQALVAKCFGGLAATARRTTLLTNRLLKYGTHDASRHWISAPIL